MSDDLQLNKILGAALTAGLVIMGVKIGAEMVYKREAPEKPGYLVAVADTAAESGGETVVVLPDWGTVLATADIAAGEEVFKKCTGCHSIAQGGPNINGPNLFGVVGRPTGSHDGMEYSAGMMAHAAEAPNWTYDQLFQFLGAPAKWVKGTKMNFPGVKKPEDRVNLIAYLRSQGSTGYAIPAPDPSRAPGAAAPGAGAAPTAEAPAAGAPAADAAAKPAAATAAPAPATPAPAEAAH